MQNTMNLLLVGAASLPIGYMAFGFIALVVPPKCAACPSFAELQLPKVQGCLRVGAAGADASNSPWALDIYCLYFRLQASSLLR